MHYVPMTEEEILMTTKNIINMKIAIMACIGDSGTIFSERGIQERDSQIYMFGVMKEKNLNRLKNPSDYQYYILYLSLIYITDS